MSYLRFKSVLFDYDGVIANTSEYNYQSWYEAFLEENIIISRREYFLMEGMGPGIISKNLCAIHRVPSCKETEIMKKKELLMMQNAGAKTIYTEIPPLLEQLGSREIKSGLVTGASRERIINFLNKDVIDLFSAIITSNDVIHTKPDPEPYLKASKMLGISSRESIVIENAPLGIESAKRGGFYCAALKTTLEERDLRQADKIFNDHKELSDFLLS